MRQARRRAVDVLIVTARSGPTEGALSRWLRGDLADRARYADMHTRFRNAQPIGALVGGTTLLVSWWHGPELVGLVVLGGLTMIGGVRLHSRLPHAEAIGAVAFLLLELNAAAAVLLSGGATSPLLPLMAVPVFSQAVAFRLPLFVTGMLTSMVLAVLAVVLAPPAVPAPDWLHVVAYLALLGCLALAGHWLLSADLHSRDEAVVDPMTGLYNRVTLNARFDDLQRRAADAGTCVGLVMLDVDHFKQINDEHGHDRGDLVLQELADRLRRELRVSDIAYRIGGEEFVVLLPGRDASGTLQVAERLRRAVQGEPLSDLPVTLSAGVVSGVGGIDSLADLLRAADGALYRAKRGGRNQVVAAEPVPGSPRQPVPGAHT